MLSDVGIVREIVSRAEVHHYEKCQKRREFAEFNLFDLLLAYEEVLKERSKPRIQSHVHNILFIAAK